MHFRTYIRPGQFEARRGCAVILLVFSSWAALVCGRAADGPNAGPLIDDSPLTLSLGHRTEALGPLFYSEDRDGQKTWAIPPLVSRLQDPATDSEEFDIGYPLLTYDRFGLEYRWQFCQVFSFAGGQNQQEQISRRFTIFPVYFRQRSADSNQNYTAIFPLYGHLKNRLFRDEIFFVMFPFYSRTRKKDVVTDNYLYPFFHTRRGDALTGWQVWPFVGRENKDPTSETNGFGDVEINGGHRSLFVLWPFFLKQDAGIGTDHPQQTRALLPLYSTVRSPQRDSTTLLWPFFTHITDREKKFTEWEMPWPLVVFARGEGKTTSRVWPFFSHAQNTNLESAFVLWPVYKFNRVHADPLDRRRTRILFFLYSDIVQKNTETGAAQHRVDFWPLFTYRRDYDGRSRFQMFSILEPLLPDSKSIERGYSPLWSAWRAEKNPGTGASSRSLLWNLYRRDSSPAAKKCSLLFGLFQYQSDSNGKRLRLFYVPVVRTKPTASASKSK